MKLLRIPTVLTQRGCSRSHHYADIDDGLFTMPVKIGPRASAWPEYESNVINSARIANWDDEQLKRLVKELHEFRRKTPGMTNDEIDVAVARIAQRVGPSPAAA